MTHTAKYAIAIEDTGQLFLFLDIIRSSSGDVYVNSNENHPNHKPHSSYHASGQHHHKSHNKIFLPKKILQPPNNQFKGSQNIWTTTIRKGEGRSWNIICERNHYMGVMIIKDEIIIPEFGFQLSIDLYQSGLILAGFTNSIINIIQQETFNNDIPQIIATLYEVVSQ